MTNNTPLPASVHRTIASIAKRGGVDALLDFRSTLTKAIAGYEASLAKAPEAHGASMLRRGIVTGHARIELIDAKLAELTK